MIIITTPQHPSHIPASNHTLASSPPSSSSTLIPLTPASQVLPGMSGHQMLCVQLKPHSTHMHVLELCPLSSIVNWNICISHPLHLNYSSPGKKRAVLILGRHRALMGLIALLSLTWAAYLAFSHNAHSCRLAGWCLSLPPQPNHDFPPCTQSYSTAVQQSSSKYILTPF